MFILKNEKVVEEVQELLTSEYSYRVVKSDYNKADVYGIEVERMDFKSGELVSIERESVIKVSPIYTKVENMVNLLSKNKVSPIHLIDVLGEEIDKCVFDFMN